MDTNIWFGFIRSNVVSQGGVMGFGVNIVQNRNSTKQNIGNQAVGGGVLWMPVAKLINFDADWNDAWNYDANNVIGSQM